MTGPGALPAPLTLPRSDKPLVVGVDLSLTATGMAWPDGRTLAHGRTGLTSPNTPPWKRGEMLEELCGELVQRVMASDGLDSVTTWPDLVTLEEIPPTGTRLDRERCYLWWAFLIALTRRDVLVLPIPPTSAKLYVTGRGDANKREVIAAVQERFPGWEIHKTSKTGKPLAKVDDNKADAVTLMAMGRELLGAPLVEMPESSRRALTKLSLPDGRR